MTQKPAAPALASATLAQVYVQQDHPVPARRKLARVLQAARCPGPALAPSERLDASTGMVLISAAIRDIEGADKKHLMVMLPLGMAIPPGMQAGIYPADLWEKIQKNEKVDDSKIQPVKLQYTLCHAAGCTAEVEATPELLKQVSENAGMIVYAVNGNGAPIAFPGPLTGFKGALTGTPADNKFYAEKRGALMKQIADAEVEHFKGRDRCVEHLRKTLSAEQFAELTRLYLAGLR